MISLQNVCMLLSKKPKCIEGTLLLSNLPSPFVLPSRNYTRSRNQSASNNNTVWISNYPLQSVSGLHFVFLLINYRLSTLTILSLRVDHTTSSTSPNQIIHWLWSFNDCCSLTCHLMYPNLSNFHLTCKRKTLMFYQKQLIRFTCWQWNSSQSFTNEQ